MEAGVRDGVRDGTPVVRVAVYDVAARAVAERQVAVAQRRLHRIALDTEEEQVGRIAPEPTLEPVGPERQRNDDLIGEEGFPGVDARFQIGRASWGERVC